MRLRIEEGASYNEPLDEWPRPATRHQVEPSALHLLLRDLRRYSETRILGRSYLIAGHRGAGKTALIMRAVDQVRGEMITRSSLQEGAKLPDGAFQRPLLVKLHGPSMLQPQPAAPPPKRTGDGEQRNQSEHTGPPPPPPVTAPEPDDPPPGVPAALVQITIGLYRSLAAELATGYRAHARLVGQAPPGDAEERAAQLALELDSGPDPALIRKYWAAIGRLRLGILWPKRADPVLHEHAMGDQGLREATALATAAQAFQVCSGQVSYSTKAKDNFIRDEKSEITGSSDVKELVARLGTLGIGTLAGVTLWGSAGPAAATGAGLLIWMLGSVSITWSRKATRTDDRSVDYSFIRDRQPTTLDRDLPVVINRVREAGLAPVFVIDELDKVPNATEEIVKLVGSLKHLVADFGFFCFLVNRDCYEEFERRVAARDYPPEHTLFSERLLLRPEPQRIIDYLMKICVGEEGDENGVLARAAFALTAMHETRMNLTDLVRLTSRLTKDAEATIGDSDDFVQRRKLILATVQLAINEVLAWSELADRMQARASFAQLALDTLYYPSRTWREGNWTVDPSQEALAAYLEDRLRPENKNETAYKPAGEDLVLLHRSLVRLLDSLTNLGAFRNSLADRKLQGGTGPLLRGEIYMMDLVPEGVGAILRKERDSRYTFLFDRDGEAPQASNILDRQQRQTAEDLIAYADQFFKTLEVARVDLRDLARTPLLKTASGRSLNAARTGLSAALRVGKTDADSARHLEVLETLKAEIVGARESLAWILTIAASVSRDAPAPKGALGAFRRLIPFEEKPANWIQQLSKVLVPSLPETVAQLEEWTDQLWSRVLPAPGEIVFERGVAFQALVPELFAYFAGLPVRLRFSYKDLVGAARGELPFARLDHAPANMLAGDWSQLALAAFPTRTRPSPPAPYWMLPAALRGLGFGKAALDCVADADRLVEFEEAGFQIVNGKMGRPQCAQMLKDIVEGAPDRPSGILLIDDRHGAHSRSRPAPGRGTLVVRPDQYDDLLPALKWMEDMGIYTGLVDAREEA